LSQKALAWIGVGTGLLVAVLALWLLIAALTSGNSNVMGMGMGVQSTVGIGAVLNLASGAAVAAGGLLKARDEKLI
jgi:hypothetical protein